MTKDSWEKQKRIVGVINKVNSLRQTYAQKWSEYNQAKTSEKIIALKLLNELIENFELEKSKKNGRPLVPLNEQMVCMFLYCYSRFSSRRVISDLELARQNGLLNKTPHFNTVCNFFKKNEMTKILSQLIEITALPLRLVEENIVIDSSGFSTSLYERWFNIRAQAVSRKRTWKKVHLSCGAKTHCIISVKITPGTYADSPELVPLVENTARYFSMKEVSADKAYLSRNNLNKIAENGAIPFIPFKSNSVRNSRGSRLWKQMWMFFYENQEEFMKHYHARSNIETTFSMLKRIYGNFLRMRNETGQINEILMKCLCHNLTVLVQESFELGIKIDFKKCAEDYFAQLEG